MSRTKLGVAAVTAAIVSATIAPSAQMDLSGSWGQRFHEDLPERGAGPEIGDYLGLPINDAARLRADSWDAAKWTMPERQCEPHPADYAPRGPASMRMSSTIDPVSQDVTSWHTTLMWMLPRRTIYMDGRTHPSSNTQHSWQGFSTGEWEGDMLKVTTTHLKEGWVRRNGVPRSDKGTLVEYFIRHGDYLTLVTVVKDPVYLTEAFVRTSNWVLDPGFQLSPFSCIPTHRDRTATRSGAASSPRDQRVSRRVRRQTRHSLRRDARRRRDDVPGLHGAVASDGGPMTTAHRVALVLFVCAALAAVTAQQRLEVLPVQGNVFVIVGPGGNTTVQIGPEGPLVVDTQPAALSGAVLDAIRSLTAQPIRHIVLTSGDDQAAGGAGACPRPAGTFA